MATSTMRRIALDQEQWNDVKREGRGQGVDASTFMALLWLNYKRKRWVVELEPLRWRGEKAREATK